jgi:hypothetical protein
MTYYNDLNTGGVTVDGVQETPVAGAIQWQMLTGAQGTVVQAGSTSTNIPGFTYSSYYYDHDPASVVQCTGDGQKSYGASGVYVSPPGGIPCTDPGTSCTNYLNSTSTMYYEAPSASVASAQALDSKAKTPLAYAVQLWQDPSGDADGDSVMNASDNCPLVPNLDQTNTDAGNMAMNRAGQDALGDACDADDDGDGYPDTAEASLGKNAISYCQVMRADIDSDHTVTILDLSAAAENYGQSIPPAPERSNQDGDMVISILDLSEMAGVFLQPVSVCA